MHLLSPFSTILYSKKHNKAKTPSKSKSQNRNSWKQRKVCFVKSRCSWLIDIQCLFNTTKPTKDLPKSNKKARILLKFLTLRLHQQIIQIYKIIYKNNRASKNQIFKPCFSIPRSREICTKPSNLTDHGKLKIHQEIQLRLLAQARNKW